MAYLKVIFLSIYIQYSLYLSFLMLYTIFVYSMKLLFAKKHMMLDNDVRIFNQCYSIQHLEYLCNLENQVLKNFFIFLYFLIKTGILLSQRSIFFELYSTCFSLSYKCYTIFFVYSIQLIYSNWQMIPDSFWYLSFRIIISHH